MRRGGKKRSLEKNKRREEGQVKGQQEEALPGRLGICGVPQDQPRKARPKAGAGVRRHEAGDSR